MTSQFSKFDGSIPDHYDNGLGPHIFVDYARDLARRVATPGPRRVLEIACGTGIVTRVLRDDLDPACQLVATDLNEPMLAVTRGKFAPQEQVDVQPADAQSLPFDDASFDAVTCQFGVMFFPDRAAAYDEAHRVLEPGGRYVFNVWRSFDQNPFARITHETVLTFFGDQPPGFYQVPFSYHDTDEITATLEACGFSDVATDTVRLQKTVADYDLFARGLVFGNPVIEEIRGLGDTDPETVRQSVAAALRESFGTEPSTMPLEAVVVTATRS